MACDFYSDASPDRAGVRILPHHQIPQKEASQKFAAIHSDSRVLIFQRGNTSDSGA